MTHVTYSDLRKNLTHYLNEAISSRAPIIVTRKTEQENVVLLSEEEFSGLMETVHLLSSPTNAARLQKGIEQADKNTAQEHTLIQRSE